jgi:hypothetical protein
MQEATAGEQQRAALAQQRRRGTYGPRCGEPVPVQYERAGAAWEQMRGMAAR